MAPSVLWRAVLYDLVQEDLAPLHPTQGDLGKGHSSTKIGARASVSMLFPWVPHQAPAYEERCQQGKDTNVITYLSFSV